jgi:FkbM family methyltransferase
MNALRFLKKCLFDQRAAINSAKLVLRGIYGERYWKKHPGKPLIWKLAGGGRLALHEKHAFTQALWPAIENYEPEVRDFVLGHVKPGMTFVDCGSNIGYFSAMVCGLLKGDGQLLAIEANPETFQLVTENLKLNGFGKVIHCAATRCSGEVELFAPTAGDVYSSLKSGGLVTGEGIRSWKVPGRSLDDIVAAEGLKRLDVLKIDIEGAELDALRGAERIMTTLRPWITLEYSAVTWKGFGSTLDQLLALVSDRNYRMSVLETGNNSRELKTSDVNEQYINLLLTPSQSLSAS